MSHVKYKHYYYHTFLHFQKKKIKEKNKTSAMGKYIVVFFTVLVYVFSIAYGTPGIATFYTSYTRKNISLLFIYCVYYPND